MGDAAAMKIPRPLLHAARIADEILFFPALLLVVWGELSGNPPEFVDLFGDLQDKALHFIAYFGLAGMAAAALKRRRSVYFASLGLFALGGVLEIVQGFTGRDMSAYDQIANTLGVVAGALVTRSVVERVRRDFGYW